ncbi:MAG: anti-sigma factor family protein, partial [Burkholderiaceae bacterium]
MSPYPITEADIQAYVDGLLPAARRAEIDVYLANHPDEAARVAAYRAQNAALRSLFNPVLDEPVPGRLSVRPRASRHLRRLAAGFAIAIAGGAAGWTLRGTTQSGSELASLGGAAVQAGAHIDPLARQAAIAHVVYSPDVRRPVEIGAEQEDQLVAWLSKRMGGPIRTPTRGNQGDNQIRGRQRKG